MKGRRRIAKGALVRRIVQTAALVLFFGLLLWTRRRADASPSPWLQLFFLIDPLVMLLTWLSAHAVPIALLASLITLAVTLVLGRVFCGWICPLGTLNAIAGRFLDFCWPGPKRPGALVPLAARQILSADSDSGHGRLSARMPAPHSIPSCSCIARPQ